MFSLASIKLLSAFLTVPVRCAAQLGALLIFTCTCLETLAESQNLSADSTHKSHIHEVVVSASQPVSVFEMDRSANVFTAQDIAAHPAQSIPDLLSSTPNITLTSFSGNEKFTRLDIRGSGDTSVSNVLTLIDGIKINTPDLAGADYASVSLNHVERIEIIRGGNSVRYGNGASHGIINIITKRPTKSGVFTLHERGSFNSDKTLLAATASGHNASLMFNYVDRQSDGYRDYNLFESSDFLTQYRQQLGLKTHLFAKVQRHSDNYQLPGPLSRLALDSGQIDPRSGDFRRGTSGKTNDNNNQIQLRFSPTETLFWTTNMQQRERENTFKPGKLLAEVVNDARDVIDLTTVAADTQLLWNPDSSPFSVTAGIDYNNADYSRSNGGQNTLRRTLTRGKLLSRAAFIHARLHPSNHITINAGYRRDKTNSKFSEHQLTLDTTDPICAGQSPFLCPIADILQRIQTEQWRNEAIELGFVYALSPNARLYTSAAKTFRIPNVDELALPLFSQTSTNPESTLIPQNAKRYEAGVKYDGNHLNINLAGFYSTTNNEIFFREAGNPSAGVNLNFSTPIKRSGFELDTTIYYKDSLSLGLSSGYTDAKTDDGKRIPLAPQLTASANISWSPTSKIHFYHDIRYVGSRHDGNDFNSTGIYELPSYYVASAKLQYKNNKHGFTAYLAANNIYNDQYITVSYSNAGYPANGRAIYGGISIEI